MVNSAILERVPVAARRERSAAAAGVRALQAADIPAIAGLFHKTFRRCSGKVPPQLEVYIRDLFLDHPWQDVQLPSRVYVSPEGVVDGFIGVLPLRMTLRGRSVRAALASSLMVADPGRNPIAGARLLRSFLAGPQDISLSETSNPVAQSMWQRLGGEALPAYSMEWLRVLRPAGFAVSLLGDAVAPLRWLRPVGSVIDRLLDRVERNSMRLEPVTPTAGHDLDPGDDALIAEILRLAAGHALRPAWDRASLCRFLAHAALKRRHGSLVRRIVQGRRGVLVGCYLYYGAPGRVAYALQVLASPGAIDEVTDHLLDHAFRHGCVALRGRSHPGIQDALLRRRAVFLHRSSMTVHTRDAELLAALRTGDALVTGLAGESWTRLVGHAFE